MRSSISFWQTSVPGAVLPVNTNDGFVGFDAATLKTGGASKLTPPVWDSGKGLDEVGFCLLDVADVSYPFS